MNIDTVRIFVQPKGQESWQLAKLVQRRVQNRGMRAEVCRLGIELSKDDPNPDAIMFIGRNKPSMPGIKMLQIDTISDVEAWLKALETKRS